MPDDKRIRSPLDKQRIDIDDPAEVANWCKAFRCTKAQLRAAVQAVGTSAAKVQRRLGLVEWLS